MRAGRLVLGLLIVAIGAGWLLQTVGAVDQFPWEWVLPSVLVVIGAALVADPKGKSHGGLIALGVLAHLRSPRAAEWGTAPSPSRTSPM